MSSLLESLSRSSALPSPYNTSTIETIPTYLGRGRISKQGIGNNDWSWTCTTFQGNLDIPCLLCKREKWWMYDSLSTTLTPKQPRTPILFHIWMIYSDPWLVLLHWMQPVDTGRSPWLMKTLTRLVLSQSMGLTSSQWCLLVSLPLLHAFKGPWQASLDLLLATLCMSSSTT